MHPGKNKSAVTWSFHQPLSHYTQILNSNSFKTNLMEEWVSDKNSAGRMAKMENRCRDEFPMFLAIKAEYLPNT